MLENTIDDTTTQEYMSQYVHQTTTSAPPKPQVLKVKIVSYHHPHHLARQHSFMKKGGKK